jgi:hypothetical protein
VGLKMLAELFWRLVAMVVTQPLVRRWLIERAQRSPYEHIEGPEGDRYMGRWWLFNPYDRETRRARYPWCPFSVRIHHICRPDHGRDLHDHPWNARTIVLRGYYGEWRLSAVQADRDLGLHEWQLRDTGDTAKLRYGEFHRISDVCPGGAWTLFITGRYQGTWGFWVKGKKVPYREHLT